MKEYWPEHVTQKSWERLTRLTKEFDFILIGGWAVYLYTGLHKSKDIDILINLETLYSLKSMYDLKKNEHLKKYEIEDNEFDIDIYVPHFSQLAIPVEDIINMDNPIIKGIKTVTPEVLLTLKQSAFIDRHSSVKGGKDAIDIITLLMYTDVDFERYITLLNKYKHKNYLNNLLQIIQSFNDIEYTGMDFIKYNHWKKDIIKKIKASKSL
ncbi:hypothetical protein J7J90_01345 [Candidatus Micrarchaeota archaeon]|nr:hypothetical protein [Candidatus Micrarchaeota archaeon]